MALILNKSIKKVSSSAYLFLLLSLPAISQTHWGFDENEAKAYQLIISLKVSEGQQLLNPQKRPASLFLLNFSDAIKLLISEDPTYYEDFKDSAPQRIELIRDHDDLSPYRGLFLAEMYLQNAFVQLKFGDEWDAAWNIKKAYQMIIQNQRNYPDFIPNLKSLGLLHVMIGSVPEKYQWILGLLGMHGTIEQGIEELQNVSTSENIFKLEGSVILNLIKGYILDQPEDSAIFLNSLSDQLTGNLLLPYLSMLMYKKAHQSEKALRVYQNTKTVGEGYLKIDFMDYLAGEIYLQKGMYAKAEGLFKRYIEHHRGNGYIKSAHYKLFQTYWLNNQNEKASYYFHLTHDIGTAFTEADKHAARNTKEEPFTDKNILKLRLLTDGGYYKEAEELIKVINEDEFKSQKERVEFIYRKARLLHLIYKEEEAISLYKKTIELQSENWYFAPNSCLQLGYIYLKKNKKEEADRYLKKALTYKNHEYKYSIDNKAKNALNH